MFQKIISRLRPTLGSPVAECQQSSRRLSHIIVPKSALDAIEAEPYRLVGSVVNYVNLLVSSGFYTRNEIPREAIQAYHCDYYYAQVNDGGHAQFVGNSLKNLQFILSDIDEGLRASRAEEYHAIFRQMSEWIAANPREVQKQTGFEGGIAPELAALDPPFYALDDEPGMTACLAQWIGGLPNLKVVADHAFLKVVRGVSTQHGERDARAVTRAIGRMTLQLSDITHLGFGLAGASKSPAEPLVMLGGAANMQIAKDREDFAFVIRTIAGTRYGVQTERGFELFHRVEGDNSHMPDISRPGDLSNITLEHLRSYHPPKVGRRIAYVPRKMAEVAALVGERYRAAAAIDLMLRRLPHVPDVDCVSVRSVGKCDSGKIGLTVLVVCDKATCGYCAIVEADEAKLLSEPDHEVLATATRAEIDDHADTYPLD